MDKAIIKEIFLLIIEVIRSLFEILWKKIKDLVRFIRHKFFGMAGIPHEQATKQEWGVTGEDTWPSIPEVPHDKLKESQQIPGKKEVVSVPETPESPVIYKEKQQREVISAGKWPGAPEAPYESQQKIGKKEVVHAPPIPELPESYEDNRIVLMMRDPSCLFTYWEIRKDAIDNILNTLGTLARTVKMVLRVYDVTDIIFTGYNAHKYFDIEITGGARSWYINVEPNRSFFIDIGFLLPNGTFRILSRSNTISTPPATVSEIIDKKWMYIKELYEKKYIPGDFGISESVFEMAHKD